MKKPLQIIFSLIFVIICLIFTRTFVSNSMAVSGEVLGQITKQTSEYKTQNAILGEELYSQLSLTNLSEKASKLGFVEQKDILSLSEALPLAVKQ